MKLQQLTIHNIASIGHAEIDFERGALADDPLFLITGRTGSGKTTILNAICLALYDEVPCLTDVKDDRSRENELKISSPAQLMRKGCQQAEVTLTFQCGDVVYKAVWEAHYSNRRTRADHRNLLMSRSLTNNATGETFTKKTEINALIREVVGLTFEQFTRTTMLAQGQFAAFMRADEKDKADILEKLTGTEIYTRIGKKIFELMKDAEALHTRLSSDVSEIKLLKDEEKAEIKEKIDMLTMEATKASLKIAAIDKQLEWLRASDRLQKTHGQIYAEFSELTAIAASDEYKEKISCVERYDRTVEIRAQIKRAGEIRLQIDELSADLDNYRKDKARKIADGLCHIEREIAVAKDKHTNLAAEHGEMEPMAAVYADMPRIEEKASQLKSLMERYSATEVLIKQTEAALDKSRKAGVPLTETIDAINKETAEFDAVIKDIDFRLAEYDRSALTSAKSAVDNEILRLTRIDQLIETLESRRKDLEESENRIKKNAENLRASKENYEDIEARIPRLTAEYEKCRSFLDGQKTLADHIGQLRSLYAESHTCPLCGNTNAEMLTDTTINDLLEEAYKKEAEANRALLDAKAAYGVLKNQIADTKKRARELADEESRKRKLVDVTISDLMNVGCDTPDEVSMEKLRQDESDLKEKSKDYEKKIGEADSLMAQREKVSRQREKNIDKKDKAEQKLQKQQQEVFRLAEKLDQQQESLKVGGKDIDVNIGLLAEMTRTQLTIDQYETVVEGLKKQSEHYSSLKELLSQCEKEIAESIKVHDSCKALIPDILHVYIEGITPSPKKLVNPEVKISEYGNVLSRKAGELTTCENQLADLMMRINAFFEAAPFSREDVKEISKMPEDSVKQWRADIKDVAEKLTRADGALTGINRQIEDHNEMKPVIAEEATIDSLSLEKEQAEKRRDTAKDDKNNLANRLDENERLYQTYQDKIAKREEAAAQLNEWLLLNKVFGNADGAKFRAIAQSYVLRALLVRANDYLSWLSSRYTLDCKDGSLAIDVIDLVYNNTVRNVSLLSGGESFVVSLALALGLSAISKDKIDVDILFIDEGFGTLDHETLEIVIETLDSLHRRGGRRIGIISHVTQLAERIPTQIRLVPDGPGLSKVVTH